MNLPHRLVQAIKNRTFVPFVGSGLSKQSDQSYFPNWDELLRRMLALEEHEGRLSAQSSKDIRSLLDRGRYLMAAEALRSTMPVDRYHSFLEEQFDPARAEPSDAHKALFALKPRFLITTNYDRLLENTYASINSKAMTVLDYGASGAVQRRLQDEKLHERPFLYKIHGDIEDATSIILTETDYRKLTYDEHGYRTVLSSVFIHFVVLFIGFSLSDEELLLHLGKLRYALKGSSQPDYVLATEKGFSQVESERFRKDFGLEILAYGSTHRDLSGFLERLARETTAA